MRSLRSLLQEAPLARALHDRLRLAQAVHLLVERSLAGVEVLEREVAALVEVRVLVHELLQLVQSRGQLHLRRHLILLRRGFFLALVGDGTNLVLNGGVRVLDERLVGLLRVGLRLDGVRLHRLRFGDDLLQHAHHPAGSGGLLVGLEPGRRRRTGRLLGARLVLRLHESLVVEALEHVERRGEKLLRLALVRDNLLEILVLELTVLTGTLQLDAGFLDLRVQRRDRLREFIDVGLQVVDLGLKRLDVALLHLSLDFVLVQRLNAEILHLDVVVLLLLQVRDHPVDFLDDLLESIETHTRRQRRHARLAGRLRNAVQDLLRRCHTLGLLLLRNLDEVEGGSEGVVRVVRAQDGEGLANSLNLFLARLRALLVLRVRHLARLLQVEQENLVRIQRRARVVEVLLRLGEFLIRVGELLGLRVALVRAGFDLRLLRGLEIVVRLLALHLLLLRARQVALEGLLHLLQDSENSARLRRVALLEGRLGIEVIARRLDERRDRLLLSRRCDLVDHVLVLAELALDQDRDVDELVGRHLHELGVVLAQDGDRTLQGADGLKHVLLLAVELREFLLANGGGLIECRLILRDLGAEVLDLRVQPSTRRSSLLDGRREIGDVSLSVANGHGLALVVRLAPARDLFENLLVLLTLLFQLRAHILEKVDDLRNRPVLVLAEAGGRCLDSNEQPRNQEFAHHGTKRGKPKRGKPLSQY